MKNRVVLVIVVVLAVVGAALLAAWPSLRPSPPPPQAPATVVSLPKTAPPPTPAETAPAEPARVAPAPEKPNDLASAPAPPTQDQPLTAETLKNTSWERGEFRIDLAPDGNVVIGKSNRAKWTVEGDRVKLYSDTLPEVHYLDIRGGKLYWEGEEIGRAK